MSFHVGQRVVYFRNGDVRGGYGDEIHPTVGCVYVVRDIRQFGQLVGLHLYEIANPARLYKTGIHEPYFNYLLFRPVRDTDISIFTAMLNPAPKKELETIPARTSVSLSTGDHRPSCAEGS